MAYKSAADKARAIIGDRSEDRPENDFYPTPPHVTEALLEREKFNSLISEVACGDGAISEVLKAHGYQVISSDIEYRGYGLRESLDFLEFSYIPGDIVTNPPFSLANRFIHHAMVDLEVGKMALFLKLAALETSNRKPLLEKYLTRMYVFSSRVSLYRNGIQTSKHNGMLAFGWFIFEQNKQKDYAEVRWI